MTDSFRNSCDVLSFLSFCYLRSSYVIYMLVGMGWKEGMDGIFVIGHRYSKSTLGANKSNHFFKQFCNRKGIFGLNPASGVVETVQLTLGPYCIITHQLVVHSKTYDLEVLVHCAL